MGGGRWGGAKGVGVGLKNASLTVAAHADSDALFEATVLTSVAIDPQDGALLILGARAVLDLLLDAPPEETLPSNKQSDKN